MMDKERIAHDLSVIAAKIKVEMNLPEYRANGYENCVSDLLADYMRSREQIINELRDYD